MMSHMTHTSSLETKRRKNGRRTSGDNSSIKMISLKLQNIEKVLGEPLRHMPRYARMREKRRGDVSDDEANAKQRKGGKAR